MIVCPTCGHENPAGSRFCSNCGTALTQTDPAKPDGGAAPLPPKPVEPATGPASERSAAPVPPMPQPRTWDPQPTGVRTGSNAVPATAPEWRMSDAGPLPAPRGRRRWLWIIVGILGACLLVCVGLTIWGNTDSGTRFLNDLATSVSEAATPRPATPAAGE